MSSGYLVLADEGETELRPLLDQMKDMVPESTIQEDRRFILRRLEGAVW
ncbi:hypothetical protein [Exiguobacterium sp. SH5S13]|nr:hypothetical protein [Exiguobacterium sp. SH5S13]